MRFEFSNGAGDWGHGCALGHALLVELSVSVALRQEPSEGETGVVQKPLDHRGRPGGVSGITRRRD